MHLRVINSENAVTITIDVLICLYRTRGARDAGCHGWERYIGRAWVAAAATASQWDNCTVTATTTTADTSVSECVVCYNYLTCVFIKQNLNVKIQFHQCRIIGGSIGSGWSAWSKGWRPPGAACYIRQMNRVNSRSGSALLRLQHHKHCSGYYYYYYYYCS